jgi:nicotinamidase-related amidase
VTSTSRTDITSGDVTVVDEVDLHRDYDDAGFGGDLGFGEQPAVLCVDFALAYLEPASPLYAGVEDAVASAGRVVDAARQNGVPVIHTRVRYQPGGENGGLFYQKVKALSCFDEGNPLGDFVDHPRPLDGEVVITKQYASAFFGTSLASTLAAARIDTLIICGLSTSGCVRASALDALQHGFRPLVVADAVGDRDPRPHEAALFDLQAKYADVIPESAAITYLEILT